MKIFFFENFYFSSETNDSNDYLRVLNSIWNDHIVRSVGDFKPTKQKMDVFFFKYLFQSLIRQLFIVLDRTYVLHAAVPSIWYSIYHILKIFISFIFFRELNQDLFRRYIMQNSIISNR